MSTLNVRRTALIMALDLGLLGDWLLRAPGAPGLNLALWAVAGVGAIALVRRHPGRLPADAMALLAVALLFSLALAGRDAPALRGLNFLLAAGTALLAAGSGAHGWLRSAGVVDYVAGGVRSGLAAVAGPALLVRGGEPLLVTPGWSRPALATARGVLIAAPLLLLFGGLLTAADPVFATLLDRTVTFDPDALISHLALIGVVSWGSAGYLSRFGRVPAAAGLPFALPRPHLGLVDGMVALGLLNALFLAFVLVQLRYLFGGADLVALTPDLSFAAYARRGFFELVTVVALVVPLLLLAEWSVRRERRTDEWVFRGIAAGQVVLLFAILGSALYRMHIYRQTYGLTELRLYTTVFMGWIAFVLIWLGATVLRGRRERFAFGALAAGVLSAVALNVVNPQAVIVRVNAERAARGEQYDVAYAGRLSGDAVPGVLAALDHLPLADRCALTRQLLERWGEARPGGWRTFNYGDWQARLAVDAARSRLAQAPCQPQPAGAEQGTPPRVDLSGPAAD